MFDLDHWQEIWTTITHNRWRSLLTALGVFWGIFMLVVMVGNGMGITNGISNQFNGVDANSVFFFSNSTTKPYKGFREGRNWNMTTNDLEAIRKLFHAMIKDDSGMLFNNSNGNNTVRGNKYGSFQVVGLTPTYNKINPSRLISGRFINEIDMREHRKVCVIGRKVFNDMFAASENPLGCMLRVDGVYYNVVGVIEPFSDIIKIEGSITEQIMLPLSTMQLTQNSGNTLDMLLLCLNDDVDVTKAEKEIASLLKQRHDIAPDDDPAIMSFNLKQLFSLIHGLFFGLNILIWIVGIGTLLAGVVGVSNIMLVTVRERTQEIGVRRAVGATPRQIMSQIMSESLILTLLAGLSGILFAVLTLFVEEKLMSAGLANEMPFVFKPQIPFNTAMSALAVLITFGLLAGVLPSRRALQIKAIEALQEE